MKHLALLLALALPLPAAAHEGHSHEEAPPPVAGLPAAPRFEAAGETFELVGVLEDAQLTLYLDQFASNAPVADARIEVEAPSFKGVAEQVAPAVYRLAAAPLQVPGRHALTLTVEAADTVDLLGATLQVATPAPPTTSTTAPRGRSEALLAGGAFAAALGLTWLLRRRLKRRANGASA